jgi:hypothetical protein
VLDTRICCQQALRHGDVTTLRCAHKCRHALNVCSIDISASSKQMLHEFAIAPTRCASKCGPSIPIGMIHISTSGNKLADPGVITAQGGHYQIFHISIPSETIRECHGNNRDGRLKH